MSDEIIDQKKNKFNYFKVFITAFLIFSACIIPSLIFTKGVWIYYGDFNVQQIPFYMHVHEAIREGNFFYDWGTDLGGSLIGQYSFYLTGSPFFWLTIPFPTSAVPYLLPWLSALKYAVMALTAYAYSKRYLKTETGAFCAALLYAFSGFQGAVLVYNHFHDVMAFFPLYLILFERMVEKKKYIGFTLFTGFMLIINYYFFVGEVVFIVLYFVARYLCEKEMTVKEKLLSLLRAFVTGLTGVLLAGVYIIPAVYYTLGNSRLSDTLEGYDLVAYEVSSTWLAIIKNAVMLPDVSGLNSMLNQNYSRVSGVGAYIPLFSIAGVIAFYLYNKEKNWIKRLFTMCLVFAAFPVLNALFSALNSEYYARWYYMPILFMAMMTASVIENRTEEGVQPCLKKGVTAVAVITVAICLMSVLPAKTEDDTWTVLGALKNHEQLISEIIFSVAMLAVLFIYERFLYKKNDRINRIIVIAACLVTTGTMFATGTLLVDSDRKTDFIAQAIKGESPLSEEEDYYRFETDEDFYNYPLIWTGSHCITSFISTISDSTLSFYDEMDVPRKVTSNLYTSRIGMRALLSSKYFLGNTMHSIEFIGHIEDMSDLKGYNLINQKNGFKIYENENYIPMGFTFDECVTEEKLEETNLATTAKDRLLVQALILSKKDASRYSAYIETVSPDEFTSTSLQSFENNCKKRAATACDTFETSTYGFTATTTLDKNSLVFFSVPYEEGFTAYVDGVETEIVKADYGFMAIPVKEGYHEIEFKYRPSGLKIGLCMSGAGLALFAVLVIISVYGWEKKKVALNLEKGVD